TAHFVRVLLDVDDLVCLFVLLKHPGDASETRAGRSDGLVHFLSPVESAELRGQERPLGRPISQAAGRTAVASISTFASSSIRSATCTLVIAGQGRPRSAR